MILEDETIFEGHWHGPRSFVGVGEVVFNTSMTGYQEIITDPSYFQQIVVMTAPEQGNYGCLVDERESKKVHAEGFVCVELNAWSGVGRTSLESELRSFEKPTLSGVDTRALTLHLRTRGTPWGALIAADGAASRGTAARGLTLIEEKKRFLSGDWVYEVTVKKTEFVSGTGLNGRVAVFDFGAKKNIVNEIKHHFREIAIFPSRAKAEEILDWAPDGIVLTNGPGDPAQVVSSVGEIKKLLGKIPLFGICMGHQLLALAAGGKTYKLKFGHRGGNHPVKDLATGEIYMTSQNHGYAVDEKSLPSSVKVSQVNLYDKTVEGIEIPSMKAWSVQYHPEACPGPHDSRVLFDRFQQQIKGS